MTPGAALWSGREDHQLRRAVALLKCRHPKENGMATKDERVKALEVKQAQIRAQIQALKARDTAQERKDETRRKVLVGGVVLKMVRESKLQKTQLNQWLDESLTADRDRVLFGLAAKPALSPAGVAGGAVSNV
jgi:large subunit ribosomal protein L7/L12